MHQMRRFYGALFFLSPALFAAWRHRYEKLIIPRFLVILPDGEKEIQAP
jgi:hypothetical protein